MPKKIFSWVIRELAAREWCTPPPPPHWGGPHLVTVPPRVRGDRCPGGGGAGQGGTHPRHLQSPPPCNPPPLGGTITWPKKHRK